MSTVVRAYRFALEPTVEQQEALASHCGGQRKAFNWGLGRVKANLDQREAERSYGVAEDDLTPCVNWSAYSLRREWNAAKEVVAPWWADNSKEAYSSGLANLAEALGNWNASRKGQRKGPKVRFPRFKSKRDTWSCTFTTGAFGLALDRRHVRLPRIGLVRTHESTRKLARRVELDYKTTWYGSDLVTVDRWFPSSKTCCDCGAVKAKLRLSERTFHCESCGMSRGRDYNAARNLCALADEVAGSTSTESCAGTVNKPGGNPRKTTTPSGVQGSGYRHGKAHRVKAA